MATSGRQASHHPVLLWTRRLVGEERERSEEARAKSKRPWLARWQFLSRPPCPVLVLVLLFTLAHVWWLCFVVVDVVGVAPSSLAATHQQRPCLPPLAPVPRLASSHIHLLTHLPTPHHKTYSTQAWLRSSWPVLCDGGRRPPPPPSSCARPSPKPPSPSAAPGATNRRL